MTIKFQEIRNLILVFGLFFGHSLLGQEEQYQYKYNQITLDNGQIIECKNLYMDSANAYYEIRTASGKISSQIGLSNVKTIQGTNKNAAGAGFLVGTLVGVIARTILDQNLNKIKVRSGVNSISVENQNPYSDALQAITILGGSLIGVAVGSGIKKDWKTTYSKNQSIMGMDIGYSIKPPLGINQTELIGYHEFSLIFKL